MIGPLSYIGGKRTLAARVIALFPKHTTYVEAFAGGAQVFFHKKRYLPLGLPHFRIGKTGKFTFYRNQVVQWILKNQSTENS